MRTLTLFTMCLAVLIAQLDTSVVNLAVKHIGATFHSGVDGLQWIIDAYNLAYACLLLTGGTLGDLYGRRRMFLIGVAVFTAGSLVCGLAPSDAILIAGRALAGVGAALLLPTSLAILAVTYPDGKERAQAIGVWASCNGLAFAIGPTLGGFLVDAAGWRSVFLLIVPVSVLALGLGWKVLAESADPAGRRLDLPGQVLAATALGGLTLAAIEGPHWGWTSAPTLACAAIAIAAALLFLAVERRMEGALVPLDLFGRSTLSASMAVAGLMTFGMYAMLFLTPLYLQSLRGASVFAAGLDLLSMSVAFLLVSQASGALAGRFGPRAVMASGMAAMGVGLLLLSQVSQGTHLAAIEAILVVIGVGLGLNTGPVNAVAVASVPRARSGTASGLLNTARMVGATLGVAVLGALFAAMAGAGGGHDFLAGFEAALMVGGAGELLGAAVAACFIHRDALRPVAA
jgi:EmrB/QacA subfamily drug resistance transporter